MLVGKELQTIVLPHRIHVWYIYLHVVDFDGKLVAKYTKDGSYEYQMEL